MSSPAKLLITYLVGDGVVGDATPPLGDAWPAYNAVAPDGVDNTSVPDDMVTLYDNDGKPDGRYMEPGGEQVEHPYVQIFVRSVDYDEGCIKMKQIKDSLRKVALTTVTYKGYEYSIQAVHTKPIRYIGPATGNRIRYLFSQDATVSLN